MALTRPDKVSPAQPPSDHGVRVLFGLTALTVLSYIAGAAALALAFRVSP